MLIRSALILTLSLASAASMASAQTSATSGRSTFSLYCATCHGPSAKGDGPMSAMLTRRPADLTQIAQRNGGTFPADVVARVIDGRSPVKGHGGGEMPTWGDAFAKSADPTPPAERIARLVSFLESIQARP